LRSWIDQYEEAVTNHYSQELRARLSGNKFAGIDNELKPSVIGGPTRCNVSLKGNGVKVKDLSRNWTEQT
jgi:histone-lysine N-methyltransferase MLL5